MGQEYRWSRVGGHLALDLCNTVSWRLDPARTIDRLAIPADLVDWFRTVTDRSAPLAPGEDALRAVRRLRAATIGLVDAHLDGQDAATGDVATLHGAWRAALATAEIAPRLPLTATVEPSVTSLLAPHLTLAVVELLHRRDLTNLRRCDGEGCGWLFLDTTRNHSRRWCDSLDCGNRARVRAYVRRRMAG